MNQTLPHAGIMLNQYTAESLALFTQMDTQPTTTGKNAIDAAIRSLKNAGYWQRLDSLYVPKKSNAQQSAGIDWKRPTVEAVLCGSATWAAANGFVGNSGANSYIDTLFAPHLNAVNYALNSGSMGAIVDTATYDASSKALFGVVGTTGNFATFRVSNSGTTTHINSNGGLSDADVITTGGFHVVQRAASSTHQVYADGVETKTGFTTSTGLPDRVVYLLAYNNNGTTAEMCASKIAMWYAGDEFTGAEQIAIKAIFTTLFAALP